MEPNTYLVPHKAHDVEVPDSLPDSEPPAPLPVESDWAPIMEFTAADIFQHSPFGDILNSLKHLSLYHDSQFSAFSTEVLVRMNQGTIAVVLPVLP